MEYLLFYDFASTRDVSPLWYPCSSEFIFLMEILIQTKGEAQESLCPNLEIRGVWNVQKFPSVQMLVTMGTLEKCISFLGHYGFSTRQAI